MYRSTLTTPNTSNRYVVWLWHPCSHWNSWWVGKTIW